MKKRKRGINSKGISPVVTTILLILISISAVIVIAGIIVPYVKSLLGESKDCFKTLEQLSIDTESGYTCYYDKDGNITVNITVKRGTKDIDMEGFILAVSGGGNSKTFEIKEGSAPTEVKMIDGSSINIPGKGEERTYSIDVDFDEVERARIAPIIKGGITCKETDDAEISACPSF